MARWAALLLTVAGSVAICRAQQPPTRPAFTTIQPITQQPTTPLGCEYNGRFYPAGTTISETTGCMGSGELCDENGEILVWDNFGFGCCERDGQYYEDGETFTEGGVTCTCVGSENAEPAPLNCGVTTTPSVPRPDTPPPTPPAGCEYDGRIYPPGTTISETTGCRGSGTYCDENGQIYVSDNFGFGCCERDGQYYQDGETFTEGRVTCTCVGSRDAIPAPLNCTEGDCRGRWSTPEGCRGDDCDHSVSWTYNSDTDKIFFEMSARQTSDKWIGIGFSNDQLMANSDVIVAAVSPEGSVSITDRWASRRSMPTEDGSDDVENPQGSYNNGVINVNFTRQRNTGDDSDLAFTDDDCLYMFYALGGTYNHASQTLSKHATTPTISDQRICIRGDCPAREVCGENSNFHSCGHGDCQPTCEEPAPVCIQVCIPGCQCKAGFALRDGRCIPRSQCEGGGDYLDCNEPDVFWCDNGMCVHQNRTCNDEDNCGDRSDERGCPTGACKSSPCMNGASCCDLGDDEFSCLCRLGYHGETCGNFTDPCASESRCENGGTCMRWEMGGDTPPEYSCQCPPHFTGVTCEIPLPTVCDENTCENGGRCVTIPMPCMEGSGDCPEFRCVCPAGVTGYRCEFALGVCEEDSCFNDGECTQVPCKDYYSCECRNGTAGARCQSTGIIVPTECGENSYFHSCGYGDCQPTCEEPAPVCIQVCIPGCQCKAGFALRDGRCIPRSQCEGGGDYLDCNEPDVFWCDNGMCVHQNRTCNDEDNCGDRSDERGCPTGACKSSPCMNGASCCDLGDDEFSCLCRLGYHGETCGNFTDPCASESRCENGGTCMRWEMGGDTPPEYSCQCPPHFTGVTCEIPLPTVCDENTCENGGRCVTIPMPCMEGSGDCPEFRCVCPAGVTGYRCEFAIGMCEEESCFNDGECMQVPCKDYYSCECRNGTAGARCESTGIIDCSEPDVFWCDNGMCVHQNRTCNDEDNCGDRSDERGCPTGACKSSPCMNGASCCDLGDDKFSCLCRLGYHGDTCGNFTDPCASPDNPCANGGTCMSMDVGDGDGDSVRSEYSCQCPPGFTGMTCEIPLPTVCDENTCENGGRCVTATCSEGSGDCDPEFRCVCPPGVTGYRCEFVLGICEEDSCFNDGECMQVPCKDYYSCECRNGFNGPRCAMGESDAAFAVIRLVGGATEFEGRVEVRNRTGNGEWGTICDDDFDINAANVVCKQLGYGPALQLSGSHVFGEGSGPIWLDDVRCSGDEESLLDCPSGDWGEHNCDHYEDVGVICSYTADNVSLDIRLAEGTTPAQGRVEIRLGNGEWGTVCDDSFDMDDAHVVCRQLGYKFATSYEGSAYFGQGNGSIWLDDVECEGDEESLLDCSSSRWGQHNCGHSEDVGVVCAVQCEPINIGMCRNVVQYNTTAFPNLLGHVSQQSFLTTPESVSVITALMNSGCHPDVEFAVCSALVPNCIDSVQITPCKDFCNDVRASCEQVLLDLGWPWPFNCSRLNDRTQCITPYPVVVSTELTLPDEVFTEDLNNMTSPRYRMLAGTLESEASKAFSRYPSFRQATVKGFRPGSVRATLGLEFQSSGQPLSSDETVVGTLRQYVNETGGRLGNLSVSQVNVALPPAEIRLVGGSRRNEGRVEIRLGNGEWGTICDDSFDINDANVVCRQLGYGLAESYESSFYFGYGSGPIWLDEVECEGDEKNLLDCPSFGWGRHDCDHSEDVGVVCLVQCEPINIGMCRNVVPYNTTAFPNLLGHVSQQSFLTDQDSLNVITALMNSGCHPDVEFAVCSALVPNCIDSVQITPCRDFCNDIRASCEQVLVGRGQPWPFNCNSFNARTQCIRPYPVVVSTKLTLPDEVFSEDLNDRNSSRYRMLAGTLEREASKAFEAISSFRQATVERFRSGSVIAILGVQFQNNGQALPSDEAVVATLRQYINDNGGRLGDLSVSQVEVVVPPAEIRLVGGATEYEGRVEIRTGDGEWGTICDDNFDDNINAANVVCRQLGYGPALQYTGSHVFGEGSGPIWLDDVRCAGDEESLLDCPSRDWGEHNCGHSEDVGVICSNTTSNASLEIRLVGGTNPAQGRVEIRRGNGEWGTVCDDSFDINDAHVVCRQLGYGLATSYEGFGYGSGPIWLDEVECEGDEENLLDCPSNGWGDHNCGHSEDVSVFCSVLSSCEPVPWDLCTYFMGYNSTGFPNSFDHTSQLDIVLSAEYQEFTAVLANISICYPNIYEVYCQTFLPKCEERSTVFLCRSVCEEVNAACGPRGVFLPFSCDVFPADGTQECLTLASSSSSSCEPVPWEFCSSFIDYNYTGFPNSFDHASQLDLALSVEYQEFTTLLANLSICYPNIYQVYCPVFLPKCENGSKVFLCRSVCEEVNAACGPRGVSLPFSCDAFPADGTQECLTIASSTCDPIPWEFCSSYIDYDYTGFPNAFNHTSQVDVSISPEFQGFNALVPNISMCYPNIYQLYCSMFLPKCENGSRVFLCRSVCEEVNAACGPRGVSLPFPCDVFPADGTQECLTIDAPTCQPIPYDRCRNMLYSETSFTPGVPVEAAIAGAESFFATSDSIAGCHTDLEAFVCSYLFPPCTSSGTRYPCASLCNEINDACKDAANASGVAYDPGLCDRLPPGSYDENCFVPQGRSECDPIPFGRCQNMPYADTSFPNWLGWQGPTDAIGNATAIFAALDQISDCHKDLEFFLCSLYFPSCTSTGIKFPCRSLCDEINNACALRALAIGIPWDTAGCVTLPVSSYQEGCIAPKATCDGWPYECYGSPGSCVGAWEFCDGNGFCPYNDDELACSNYTCMPIELEYCRGEVPYDRMTLPNYFGQESTMMIEESDIHRNVSLLADTSCHEYVKYVYCHMAVPECIMDGVRGQPLCRSLCEEIRQTCAEEIKEIGFQFEKSTCDLIFPDSVQNDTCKLAKEFNCTFDDDTCEWMAGNSSQAVMLQPTSESNSGKYASLNGASAKLTSPTMYTDNKCLRMRYLVRGDGSRLTVYVTGPDGNSFSTWRQSSTYVRVGREEEEEEEDDEDEEEEEEWQSINLNINKGWPWFKVSLDAYVAADGEVGVDDVTLSDGSCKTEEAVSPGCEPMKFERCLDMPYNFTTYPNALGWDRDLALSLGPDTFQAFDQIADCHRDLQFYLCSFIFPECTPFGMRLPCRSFCESVSEACAARANAAGLTWDPNGCQSLPDDEPYCSVPKVQCEPINIGMCRNVVPYNTTAFPNLLGHVSQQSFLTDQDSVNVITALMNSGCHPDVEFAVCSALVPNCIDSMLITPCRDFCNDIRASCEQVLVDMGQPWPFNCNSFNARTRCITPYPVVVFTELTLPDEVFTEELNNMNSSRYRMLAGTLKREVSKAFQGIPSFRQATVESFRSGSVIANLGIEFENTGQPGVSNETVVGTLRQYINETGGRLGNLSVSQVDVAVPKVEIRLVGGSNPWEGRVEIRLGNGEWGTICDDSFDINDAHVVCRKLGYGLATSYEGSAYFGQGNGSIWLDDVECEGDEENLLDCSSSGWGQHNCGHYEDVGVVCSVQCEPINIGMCRNVVPYNTTAFPNLLGHVSQQSFLTDQDSVSVITALMNSGCHPDVEFAVCSALVPNCIDSVQRPPCRDFCDGVRASCEQVLLDMGQHWPIDCNSFDTRTQCTTPYAAEIRLVGGTNPNKGRVEIRRGNGQWGTICDDSFDINDANVVCRQLGYGLAASYEGDAFFGPGNGSIWLDDVECEGDEENLLDCSSNGWGQHNCGHYEDVGVVCTVQCEPINIGMCRNVVPYNTTAFPNLLGHASQQSFLTDQDSVSVITALMDSGCHPDVEFAVCSALVPNCIDSVQITPCRDFCNDIRASCEQVLVDRGQPWPFNCNSFNTRTQCITPYPVIISTELTLPDEVFSEDLNDMDSSRYRMLAGTLEREASRAFQAIPSFQQATVDSLRSGSVIATLGLQFQNTGQALASDEAVVATFRQYISDNGGRLGNLRVSQVEVVDVVTPAVIRLVGGATEYEGRVEVRNGDGEWGTICDDYFDISTANVVCRQLGFGYALEYTESEVFGEGSGPIWLDDVRCAGDEESLLDCPSGDWGEHNCDHDEDVGVICSNTTGNVSLEIRLVGGTNQNEGRVEIRLGNGEWGTVCDDSFDINDAHVVCRQLGYGLAESYRDYAYFGPGNGSIWLDDVECEGDEESLLDCSSSGWGEHNCGHYEDVGVVCTGRSECDPIPFGRCQNLPYSGTSFPNWLGWQGPTDAIGNATAIFAALDQISDCHKDLDFFLCSLYFPSCTSTGIKFPCRSLCDEINNACALRALAIGIPWDTAGCVTLPDSSYQEGCIAPKATCDGAYECYGSPGSCVGAWEFCNGNGFCPYSDDEYYCSNYTCMPIELEYCQGEVPYNRSTLPNYFGQESTMMIEESDIHRNVSLLADTSCHEYVKYVYCHMAVPECVMDGVRGQPLCRSLCEEIRQTCAEEIKEIGVQFEKSSCDLIFPDSVQNDTCKLAKEFNCTFDVDTCEWMADNSSQAVRLQPASESDSGKYASLNGASSKLTSPAMYTDNKCLRMRYLVRGDGSRLTVYVTGPGGNSFSTWRESSTYVREEGEAWSSINLNINKGWPWFKVSLDAYVSDDGEVGVDDVTLSDGSCAGEEAVSPGCEPMKFERCLDMPYNFTTYPNALGWDRDLALSLGPHTFQAFDQIADCHRDLQFYLCSFIFPECTPLGMRLPCRSFCESVSEACAARANAAGLTWDPNGCQSLSDDEPYCSVPKEVPECDPIPFGRCQNMPYADTSFPNWLGWQGPTDAIGNATAIFAALDQISDCHKDLDFFLCSLYFPSCTSTGIKFPCRSLCDEINNACALRALAIGIPWDTAGCVTLPESSYLEGCIAPKATCDGAYECYGSPGSCVGAWEFCDGNGFCPYNDDEFACSNYTCMPIELEYCQDEVPYDRTILPNYFGQENTMMIEESDIHRNVSLLADTSCHEYVKYVYCHMAVPECIMDGVRGQPLCRSLCEEIRQTCAEEIKEIGFQFEKSTCDMIFPDSVQNDTCQLAKEFNCTFDDDTCEWMAGNSSQAVMLQPTSESNSGKYASLNGALSKLTSPTMYTDNKCLRMRYLVRGDGSRLTVYVTGPDGNSFSTWRQSSTYVREGREEEEDDDDEDEEEEEEWSSINLNINKGWPWFKVSLDAYVAVGGEVGVDDVTLSDGSCEAEEVSLGCEPMKFERCLDMPYNFTTYPNALGWDRDLALSLGPHTFQAFDQIADCHRDLQFYLCSFIFPECTPFGMRLPCRSFCERVSEACATRANAAGLTWDPNGCQSLPDDEPYCSVPKGEGCPEGHHECYGSGKCVGPWQFCDGMPDCPFNDDEREVVCGRYECMPMDFEYCQDVVNYTRAFFPNYYGQQNVSVIEQSDIHQIAVSFASTNCHPDSNLFYCHLVVPECQENDVRGKPVCRAVCEEVRQECSDEVDALQVPLTKEWCYATFPDSVHNDTCILFRGLNCTFDDDFCNWDQVVRGSQPWTQVMSSSRQGKHITSSGPSSHLLVSPRIYTDDKCLRFYYMLTGSDTRVLLKLIGPNGVSWNAWNTTTSRSVSNQWTTASIGIKTGLESVQVSIQAFADGDGSFSIDNVTLSDGPCSKEVECEPIMIDVCRGVVPYTETLFPNLLGHSSQQAFLDDPNSVNVINQLMNSNCHPDIGFAVCSALVPRCVDSSQLPPCRGFCNEIRASCQPVLGMAGQEWPFECEAFPFEFQGECSTPAPAQCERIEIGMCRNVVPYNTTTFPNLLGHVSQQSFLTTPESVSVITALMNSGCHPDVEFAVCSALVPNCIDSMQIPPCRDFCNEVKDSCEQLLMDIGESWPFECNDFAPRGRCISPDPVVVYAALTLPDEDFTDDLYDSSTPRYRVLTSTLEREIPKAFETPVTVTVASLRPGSVIATVGMGFENTGQAPESDEAAIATLQQYVSGKRGRLGSLTVSQVVGVPPVDVTRPCDENPCGDNGICEEVDGTFGMAAYRCTCQDGFTGYNCEIRIAGRCHESIQSVLSEQDGSPIVGVFLPQCRDDGSYENLQCHPSTGYCWCVTADGSEVPGTQTPPGQNRTDCVAAMSVELYPFGPGQGDTVVEFSDLDDGTSDRINIPAGFPFFYTRHSRFYIGVNGLISFGRRYGSYIPVPFRTGSGNTRPVIAPFWADHDLRRRDGQSNVFYQEYRGKVVRLPANSGVRGVNADVAALAQNVVTRVISDVTAYADLSDDFDPSWIAVITWSNMTAYPSGSNPDQTVTHQLVLATDGVKSFALFNYGAMNWEQTWREARLGYTAADSINFFDSKYSGLPEIFNINEFVGNTGIRGKWFFRLDDPAQGDVNYDQLCLGWADLQDEALLVNFTSDSQPCPCSWTQAVRDRRFRINWDDMCAELRWTSPLGIGQRCCYSDVEDDPEDSGALLLGFPGGGSVILYDPRVDAEQYQSQDLLPRTHCCLLSRNCELFYRYRPSDTCERYDPPRWAIALGDPHLTTLDGKSYTFNGLGEYLVLDVPDAMLVVQGRTRKAVDVNGTETRATIFSAFVAKQGNSSTVQINLKDDTSGVDVYVDRQMFSGFADLAAGDAGQDFEDVTVSKGTNGSAIATFSSGIAIEVAVDVGIMAITVMAPPKFKGNTKGLLGLWNDDVTDDFTRPDGTSISINASDSDIYHSFGQLWNVSEADSIFYYGSQSWSDFANSDPDFVPLLEVQFATEELRQQAVALCGDNKECLFDTAATSDLLTGASTANTESRFEEDTSLIANFPPTIFGPTVVNATVGKEVSFDLTATDINNDTVRFSAQGLPDNAAFNNASAMFIWTPSRINSLNMSFTASDGKGGTSILRPTVNLCKCENDGTCDFDNMADDQNVDSLLRVVACQCGPGLEGTFCEVDIDGCEDDPCYMGVNCTDVPAPGVGYTCSACPDGTEGDGTKCRDIDECTNGTHQCGPKAQCRNEMMSYRCECPAGYRLDDNKRNCSDIDECADGVSGCTQLCNNTDGGFLCDCYQGFFLNATNNVTCYQDQAARNVCAVSVCENCRAENDVAVCFCPSGYKLAMDNITCEDVDECAPGNEELNRCSQKKNCQNTDGGHTCSCDIGYLLEDDLRTCTICPDGKYGVGCAEICGCNRGECNVTVGCVCPAGWKGDQCEADVNECDDGDMCRSNETCVNRIGSYECVCSTGFAADESGTCQDVDECVAGHNCHALANCTNIVGSFTCTCAPGYVGDGVTCEPATTPAPSTTPTPSTSSQSTSAPASTPAAPASTPTASRPTATASRPTATASRPTATTSRPTATASRPTATTSRPTATASRPTATASRPTATASRPTATASRPTATTSRPTATTSRPTATASRPTATASRPTATASRPTGSQQTQQTTPTQAQPAGSSTAQQTITTPLRGSTTAKTSKTPTVSQSISTAQSTPAQASTARQTVTTPVRDSTTAQTSKQPTVSQSISTPQSTPGSQTAAESSTQTSQPTTAPAQTTPDPASTVVVPTEVTLVWDFTEDLNNRTHPVFIDLENKVKREVSKAYENNPNFQSVIVKGFSAGSVIASFDTVFKKGQTVPDPVEAVALLKQYIDNNGGKLGDLSTTQVSYAPPGTTPVPITDCECAVEVNCVSYGGKCLAFCSPNPDYCLNGGTCMDSNTETLTCQCTSSFTTTYSGDRCESRGTGNVVYAAVGAVAAFLLLLILIIAATKNCWKSKSQPLSDNSLYANRRAMNYAPAGLERGLRSTSAAKYRPSVYESGQGATVVYDFSGKGKAAGYQYNNVVYDNVRAAPQMQSRPDEGAHVYHNPIHQEEHPYQSLVRPHDRGYQQPTTTTFTGQQKITNLQRNVHVNQFQIPRAKSPYRPATSYSTNFQTADDSRL
ncbi:uncharacterized protein LOC144910683 isoform X6 [Branchiostoma floridae x Branchiostoma belcheri]